jgi:diguanylate cyclase (GGDEF)-like protein
MERPSSPPTTLHSILARFNFFTTLLAVTLAWLAILLAGMTALKSYAAQNLDMAAQLASYGAEPGLVFDDAEAAREAILPLLHKDGIARIHIGLLSGAAFVDEASANRDPSPMLTQMFVPEPANVSIYHNGLKIGRVMVWGNASALLGFARLGFLAGLGCLAISVLGTLILRRRFDQELAQPLRAIATVAHDVRLHRRFDQRVAPVGVAELDRLGGDINALLEELQGWQGHMEHEHAALAHSATHDTLTGLPNRAAFDQRFASRIAAGRQSDSRFAMLFIDADNFKQANDIYGHAAGDQVLMLLAQRIKACLREGDFAARFGGDEFVIILDPVRNAAQARQVGDALRDCVAQPMSLNGRDDYSASISVGVAVFPEDGATATELLTAADAAMYADKFRHRAI